MAARHVRQTPERLIAIVVSHDSSLISSALWGLHGDAGVGHDDVQASELRHPGREHALQISRLAHVAGLRHDAAIQGLDEPNRLLEVGRRGARVRGAGDLGAQVERDDVGAILGQPDRVAAPLAAGSPGHERDLSVESSHLVLRHAETRRARTACTDCSVVSSKRSTSASVCVA
jgi:hypothetical protein